MPAPGRIETHVRLSRALGALDDGDVKQLLGPRPRTHGWGASGLIDFDGERLFVKRVPLTALEYGRGLSTRNHFAIPTFYNYGVGSAGFGVARELAAHLKTSDWVLKGACEGFPLMYHHRVLRTDGAWGEVDEARHAEYVRRWNGDGSISRYMLDRMAARHEAVMFLEHIPFTMNQWLTDNLGRVDDVVVQVLDTISFLRANGVVHFDAHFGNVVTNGDRHYLTDFGLVLDGEFDLSETESAFLEGHLDYDYGEALYALCMQLAWRYTRLSEDEGRAVRRILAVDDAPHPAALTLPLIARVEDVAEALAIPPAFQEAVVRYRHVALYMGGFLDTLRENPRKDTPFDAERLRTLLIDAGVL